MTVPRILRESILLSWKAVRGAEVGDV